MLSILFLTTFLHGQLSVPGSESTELAFILDASQKQLAELHQLVQLPHPTADQLQQAADLTSRLLDGIDKPLKALEGSEIYQAALLQAQQQNNFNATHAGADEARDYVSAFQRYFPDEAKKNEENFQHFKHFQSQSVNANSADINDVSQFKREIETAHPGELSRRSLQMAEKDVEVNLRVSTQLTELISEMRALREEISREHMNQKIRDAERNEAMEKTMAGALHLRK